jgi:hypothetical protein
MTTPPDIDAIIEWAVLAERRKSEIPEGWVLVPREPTLKMAMAGEDAFTKQNGVRIQAGRAAGTGSRWPSEEVAELCARVAYRAMIASAPSHSTAPSPKPSPASIEEKESAA